MKKELINRIYNYEVNPPLTTWHKISGELDDLVFAQFPGKIQSLQLAPPSNIWDKISKELDQDLTLSFVTRLRSYEALPPAGIFDKITSKIADETGTPVVKMPAPTSQSWMRYAMAAAVVGLIMITAYWFTTSNEYEEGNIVNRDEPVQTPQVVEPDEPQNNIADRSNPAYSVTQERKASGNYSDRGDYQPQYAGSNYYAPDNTSDLRNSPVQLATSFSIDDLAENMQPSDNYYRQIAYNPSYVPEDNPYVMVLQSDGSVVRVSKKLANMINCLNNEPTLNDIECRQKIDQWRRQIAQSPITPAPDNFLDMMDLINSIKENIP